MSNEVFNYMDKIHNYYTKKSNDELSVDEIINIILNTKDNIVDDSSCLDNTDNSSTIVCDLNLSELQKNVLVNNEMWQIEPDTIITSHRKIIGRFIIIGKKVFRKFLKWYIRPITYQQSSFNGSVTRSLNEIYNKMIISQSNFFNINSKLEGFYSEFIASLDSKIRIIINKQDTINKDNKKIIECLESKIEEILFKQAEIENTNKELYSTLLLKQSYIEDLDKKIEELESNQFKYEDLIVEKDKLIQIFSDRFEALDRNYEELRHFTCNNFDSVKKSTEDTNNIIRELTISINENREQISRTMDSYKSDIAYLTFKYNKIESKNKNSLDKFTNTSKVHELTNEKDLDTDIDYFLFENQFRGSEAYIKDTQRQYLRYFEKYSSILDIGCGRGEFLELLAENSIEAKGVDIYEDFVLYCKQKGLDVTHSDAIDYLLNINDNSLGGIFIGQVVEHLDKSYLLKLLQLCYQKMKIGSSILIETPNPTMLSTFSNSFYIDLSHIKPVHPQTLHYLLSYYGFKNIEIIYNEYSKLSNKLPNIASDIKIQNIEELNMGIDTINNLLFGYQDYTIVAKK